MKFWMAVGVLSVAIGGAIFLSDLSTIKSASMFPPYLDEGDLRTQNTAAPYGRADVLPASMGVKSSLPDRGDAIGHADGKNSNWQGYYPPTGMLPAPP